MAALPSAVGVATATADDVPRETAVIACSAPPVGTRSPMSDHTDWRAEVLATWRRGQQLSAVGPGPVEAHLDHAARFAAGLPAPDRALDLGSGAGIPGLALAGIWPRAHWVLVDAARRRVRLLADAVDRLGWADRVEVVHARAEDIGRRAEHRERYDLVVARLFGPPAVTAECAAPLVGVGGSVVVAEPPDADVERWPAEGLARLGLRIEEDPAGGERAPRRLLRKVAPTDDRFPRRPGVPERRPLFPEQA